MASVIIAYAAAFLVDAKSPDLAQEYAGYCIVALILVGAVLTLIRALKLLADGEPRPWPHLLTYVRQFLGPAILLQRVSPVLLVFTFLGAFTVMKSLIGRVHPFAWDAAFSDLDRMIFGTDPWRLTHAVLGVSQSRWIDYVYCSWLPVFAAVVLYQSAVAPVDRQRRFFLSIYGIWILLGLFGATIFSSAGPCFLNVIGNPYAERYRDMHLAQIAPISMRGINYLSDQYRTGSIDMASGISAMPSVHVAVAFLYVLTARKPWMVALASAYFLLILVGSVHIGWHYAVDGIAGVLGTCVIWRLTRRSPEKVGSSVGQRCDAPSTGFSHS